MRELKRVAAALFVCTAGLALVVPAAHAQDQDPYGGTTTTTGGGGVEATCSLSATSGRPGAPVTATVTGSVSGTVRILFDGTEVGRGTAGPESPSVEVDFTVPSVSPGRYLVAAVGADFTAACGSDQGSFEVLAAAAGSGGGGSLPKTGIYIGALLVIAVALLLVGRALTEASHQRRRLAARSRHLR